MDETSKELLVQAAVMGLQMIFTNLKLAGKTDNEINALFTDEYLKFKTNRPENLPDV